MPKKRFPRALQKALRRHRRSMRRSRMGLTYVPSSYRYRQICTTMTNTQINNAVGFLGYAFVFTLSQLNQAATFTALYDQYRINKVEVLLLPRAVITDLSGSAVAVAEPTYFISAIDNDDAIVPTSLAQLQEYGNSHIHTVHTGKPISISLQPAVAQQMFNNGVLSAYGERVSPWIDCAYPATEHYGLKLGIPASGAGTSWAMDVQVKFWIEFKEVR